MLRAALLFAGATLLIGSVAAEPVSFGQPITLPRYAEGVVFDGQDRLFVSDPMSGAVFRVLDHGRTEVWARVDGANGHKVTPDGTHVVAGTGAVVLLDGAGRELRRHVRDGSGRPLVQPNDIAIDPANGGFYVTDPGRWGGRSAGRILHVDARGLMQSVAEGLDFGNGLALTPDGRRLIVAESQRNRLLDFPVTGPGRLGVARVFAELPTARSSWTSSGAPEPDGLAIVGSELFVAHFGTPHLRVYSLNGQLLRSVATPIPSVSNIAFGPGVGLLVTGATGSRMGEGGLLAALPRETSFDGPSHAN